MPQNFLGCDRDQELLLAPSLKEWLPESHLAWFVLEAVDELDLDAFYAAYRQDGCGRAAHDPAIAQLFGSVLEVCARAGMVKVGVVAVDGTKIEAAATHHATRPFQQIA